MNPSILFDIELHNLLQEFSSKQTWDPRLNQILKNIAATGIPCYFWPHLKQLLAYKTREVLVDFHGKCPDCPVTKGDTFQDQLNRVLSSLDTFQGPPFTLQRLCELITDPERRYNSTRKLIAAVEKAVTVNSYVSVDEIASAAAAVGLDPSKLPIFSSGS
eukprot:GILI01027852.1.p1 GENE.GILI01027852.1~~GILI01027852.1.p1  ORF type:complete len:160 (-),score=7.43 GILI01027852.1:46-525(-)